MAGMLKTMLPIAVCLILFGLYIESRQEKCAAPAQQQTARSLNAPAKPTNDCSVPPPADEPFGSPDGDPTPT